MQIEEKKAALNAKGTEISEAFGEFMNAFEMFKDANDQRLSEMEHKLTSDIITREKVDRIALALDKQKNALDSLVMKKMRPKLGETDSYKNEYKHAFDNYIRTGEQEKLSFLFKKSETLNGESSDGAFLIPKEMEKEISLSLANFSQIRSLATVQTISSPTLKKVAVQKNLGRGWGEVPENTDTPRLSQIEFNTHELYALPAISKNLLQDSVVNLDEWIISEVQKAFAEEENKAFITGDGLKKPKGFLNYTTANVGDSGTEDKISCISVKKTDDSVSSILSDKLIDLMYSLNEGYRQNATWIMNHKTLAEIRKIKDTQGNYIWQPPAGVGQKSSLFGFPLVEVEQMEGSLDKADSFPLAFADFARAYLIVDRCGLQILRDPYSAKPNVLFYVTKRVGGGVQDFQAIRLLKVDK